MDISGLPKQVQTGLKPGKNRKALRIAVFFRLKENTLHFFVAASMTKASKTMGREP